MFKSFFFILPLAAISFSGAEPFQLLVSEEMSFGEIVIDGQMDERTDDIRRTNIDHNG